jgi:hypothetical protein
VTHLRRIMLEELQRRNYSESTGRAYIRTVEYYAQHFHRSPDQLGPEHIRQYQAAMFREWKLAPNTVTQKLAARNKAKSNRKPSSESAGKCDPAAEEEQKKEAEPPRTPGLFDHPAEPQPAPKPARVAPVAAAATLVLATETVSASATDEEDEILAEIAEATSEARSEYDAAA